MAEQPGLVEWGMPSTGCVFFKKTKGWAACVRGQPCGIEQYTMTEDASLVEGSMSNTGCDFFQNDKGGGCMYSGAALSNRAAYHGRAAKSSRVGHA